ncbi:ABC transporter substrate-binding protein [Ilumatobacter nonamiensis]|uniref:ABC transporter substrate-binding protein n=1 Tax=Ilumatobacter nonamiensis TaxID=467093 RepID=UPI00130E40AE|nr:ABC transporter substrate-binding protein [Ilumatobacter nonamiensis]
MRRRRGPVPAPRILAAVTVGSVFVAACTGGDDATPPPSVVTTTTEVIPPRVNDDVLKIGALIPAGNTVVAEFLTVALEDAIDRVNDAGGVLGSDVEVFIEDEGATAATASQAIEELIADGVDAIIGPTSSNTAIGALDTAVADGIVTCSATATSIALDDYPDEGLFFRSIATDSLQANAIAQQAQATGASNVAIVHVDDAYGRPYADAVEDALSPIAVETIPLAVDDDDLSDDIDDLVAASPQAAIILGSGDDIATVLGEMARRDDVTVQTIIVNDDARRTATRPVISVLPEALRSRVVVVAPQVELRTAAAVEAPTSTSAEDSDEDAPIVDPPFGPQVTDCVNLLALSAIQGQSDSPSVIAGQMSSVSDGGDVCSDFQSCTDRLAAGAEIDYAGPLGITVLDRNGDPSRAFFDIIRFDDDGSDIFEDTTAVQS